MAKSTYYFEINKDNAVALRNEELLKEIKTIFGENKRRCRVIRVYRDLRKRGHKVNHKRVQRLMYETGLLGKRPREKHYSHKGETGRIADNIIDRCFVSSKPLEK